MFDMLPLPGPEGRANAIRQTMAQIAALDGAFTPAVRGALHAAFFPETATIRPQRRAGRPALTLPMGWPPSASPRAMLVDTPPPPGSKPRSGPGRAPTTPASERWPPPRHGN